MYDKTDLKQKKVTKACYKMIKEVKGISLGTFSSNLQIDFLAGHDKWRLNTRILAKNN